MKTVQGVLRHPHTGLALRYGIAGATVAAVYLLIPLLLDGALGVAIQVAIPIAYVLAISLHFNLQRHFVFRHVAKFALTRREQIRRYLAVGAIQYPTTALLTWGLPEALGLSQRVAFVSTTLTISLAFFLVLRKRIFHPGDPA